MYVAQRKIQEYFASGTVVTTENAKEKLEEKRTELQVLVDKLNVPEEKSGLIEEIALWSSKVGEEKEEAAIEIIEKYGVDVEKDDIECIKGEHIQTISQIHNIKARITVINKQIKKFEKYMDTLEELEIAEVRYGYRYFMLEIDNADRVFIKMLINNGVFKKMMLPDEVKKQYGLFEH